MRIGILRGVGRKGVQTSNKAGVKSMFYADVCICVQGSVHMHTHECKPPVVYLLRLLQAYQAKVVRDFTRTSYFLVSV